MQCLHITYMAIYTLLGFKTLNQNTYTVGEQLQSHLSGLNYSTPVNYSFRKICSNHTSIAWFAIQEESSPFCTGGWEHTPASAADDTSTCILQHTSSRIFLTSPGSFFLSSTTTMWNTQQLSWLSLHVPLFYFILMPLLGEVKKLSTGLDFYLQHVKGKDTSTTLNLLVSMVA